jgi:hypothetical protein
MAEPLDRLNLTDAVEKEVESGECRMDGGMYPALVFIACSAMSLLHCPMEIKARILDCPDSDEHIVRRLGKAVVVLWDSLPAPVQDQLLKQAVLMHDRQRALQLKQKIKAFIKEWKTIE